MISRSELSARMWWTSTISLMTNCWQRLGIYLLWPDRHCLLALSDTPSFSYRLVWEERQFVSVANHIRQDGADFVRLAPGNRNRHRDHQLSA